MVPFLSGFMLSLPLGSTSSSLEASLDVRGDWEPDLSGFFPLWGNGHFDGYGGMLNGGELVFLRLPELDVTPVGLDLPSAVRHTIREGNAAPATEALIEQKLAMLAR